MPVEFVQVGIAIRRVGTEAVDTANHSIDEASQDSGGGEPSEAVDTYGDSLAFCRDSYE